MEGGEGGRAENTSMMSEGEREGNRIDHGRREEGKSTKHFHDERRGERGKKNGMAQMASPWDGPHICIVAAFSMTRA